MDQISFLEEVSAQIEMDVLHGHVARISTVDGVARLALE